MPRLGMTAPRLGRSERAVTTGAEIDAHVENACSFQGALTVTQP